jgi:integrase
MIQRRGSRWRVVVQGRRDDLTGRRRQLSGSVNNEREAVALERTFRLQAERGRGTRPTVGEVVQEWWDARPRLAATTLANYRSNLDVHILPMLGERYIDDLRPRLVSGFLRRLADDGLAPGTVRKVRTVLSAIMSYAVAMEYTDSNAVMKVRPPELDSTPRVAPTVADVARILLAAEESDPDFLTYLWVAAEEGGRRGETLALRWGDVDFERGSISIQAVISAGVDGVQTRSRTKTKKPRTIAVSAITLERLAAHKAWMEMGMSAAAGRDVEVVAADYVFSGGSGSRRRPFDRKPWRPDSTTRRFRRVKVRAGVPANIDLHGLRHTMITELLRAGVDPRTAMGRAGHSSEAMTMSVYAKVRPLADAAAADTWGRQLQAMLVDLRRAGESAADV